MSEKLYTVELTEKQIQNTINLVSYEKKVVLKTRKEWHNIRKEIHHKLLNALTDKDK